MRHVLYDYDDEDVIHPMSDRLALDAEGGLKMRMSDNMAMDMDTGELHMTSSWLLDDDDDDEW